MVRIWKTVSLVLLTLGLASAKREVDELLDSEFFQSIIEKTHVKQMIQHIKAQRPTKISGSSAMQTDGDEQGLQQKGQSDGQGLQQEGQSASSE